MKSYSVMGMMKDQKYGARQPVAVSFRDRSFAEAAMVQAVSQGMHDLLLITTEEEEEDEGEDN